MNGWALRASLLIAVDAHVGQWCTLAWLADKVICSELVARRECDSLAAHGLLQTRQYYGEPVYGVQVTADYPAINDVRARPQGHGIALPTASSERACKHGTRHPHECMECADEPSDSEIAAWMASEGL